MKRVILIVFMVGAVTVPAFTATTDRTPPVVRFTTANDAALVSNPAAQRNDTVPLEVKGTAADGSSGVASVWVAWVKCDLPPTSGGCTNMHLPTIETGASQVQLLCTTAAHTSCTWRATAPTTPGFYYVYAYGQDRKNNTSDFNNYIRVRVV